MREEASQVRGIAADFCVHHKPKRVLLVWPAATRAVEAYIFHALLAQLDSRMDLRTVAGFTQTSLKPSPLVVQQCRQAWRCMNSMCFRCRSKTHFARNCDRPEDAVPYSCQKCGGELAISSRGATIYADSSSSSRSSGAGAHPPSVPLASASAPQAPPVQQRPPAPAAAPKPKAKASVRKRPASAAFSHTVCPLGFNACWDHTDVRKKGRFGSVKDFLKVMNTEKAGRAMPTIPERLKTLSTRKGWDASCKAQFSEFGAPTGGGSPGTGCSKSAMRDIYHAMGGTTV